MSLCPNPQKIVVYSKSGCPNCDKVKMLLTDYADEGVICEKDVEIVNCDFYLQSGRDKLVQAFSEMVGNDTWRFPLVFAFGKYVGGFKETARFCDSLSDF